LKKKKVIVTGGAGFIGSHMVEYWINNNAEVYVIDNLVSGFLKNIPDSEFVHFCKGSITDYKLLEEIVEGTDYIFNFAAMISVPESIEKPRECVNNNVIGIINVLEAAKKCGVKKVVHSSSAAIYGDNPSTPKYTSLKPEPKSPYGITKLDGEYYCQMYYENFRLSTVSLRYFNVFGPRQDPKSQYAAAIPIFINKALLNEPVVIFGDGNQTRDFIYVQDVIRANILAAENKEVNGVFNVANGSSISILDLAKLIINETGSKSKIIFADRRAGDIKHSLASIEDTKEKLDFIPDYNLLEGLKETIFYFSNEFKEKPKSNN
jgi:UDP-glucose 4-epimerase